MEFAYKKFIGPYDPADPSQALNLNMLVMKWLGLWPPETESRRIQLLYSFYSTFLRVFLLYIYVATQFYYLFYTDSLAGAAEGFVTFLTQLALCYKLRNFEKNVDRIRKILRALKGSFFQPKYEEEKRCVKISMTYCFGFSFTFLSMLQLTMIVWMLEPYLQRVRRLPIAARFPFSTDDNLVFGLTFAYQIVGLYLNAALNIASDGVGSGLLAILNGQIQRLGLQLEKIGHEKLKGDAAVEKDEQMTEIPSRVEKLRSTHGNSYDEWVRCVMFHKCILSITREIEDIFSRPVFAQFLFTGIILCMNCFLIVTNVQEKATLMKNVSFLSGVLIQVFLFCWVGNEIIYSSRQLSKQAYFSNILNLDRATAKVMLIFMEMTYRDIVVNAGSVFRIALSLPTFLAILNTSYSYLNVMRKLDNK